MSIDHKEQVLTRISSISSELGVTTVRSSFVDDFLLLVVITWTFIAECKFPHCLCSMTHLLYPNRGKNIFKKDKVKVKRIQSLGELLGKRCGGAFLCDAFSHVHRV